MESIAFLTQRKTRNQREMEIAALNDKTLAANIIKIMPKATTKQATAQSMENASKKRAKRSQKIVDETSRKLRIEPLEKEETKSASPKSKQLRKRQDAATIANNNDSDFIDMEAQQKYIRTVQRNTEELKVLNAAMTVPPVEPIKVGYTHEQLKQSLPSTAEAENPQQENQQPTKVSRLRKRQNKPLEKEETKTASPKSKQLRKRKKAATEKSLQSTAEAENPQQENQQPTKVSRLRKRQNEEQQDAATIANNNDSDFIDMEAQQKYIRTVQRKTEELKVLNAAMTVPPVEPTKVGYTHEQLKQFLLNSSLSNSFPAALQVQSTSKLLRGFIDSIYALETVQLNELIDLYHLCFMMQHYEQEDTHCMGYRFQLLEAVSELASELQPEDADIIGIILCDRFVLGTGKARMENAIDVQSSIVLMIKNGEINRRIAMTMLLATFAKVSGQPIPELETDVLKQAFEMAQQVNWTQLVASGCEADLFLLVRSFSLILNTQENRQLHYDWDKQLGSEIHKYFMTVLRTIRFSRNYNFFAMMVERYIAFCVVRGATPRAHTTEMFTE